MFISTNKDHNHHPDQYPLKYSHGQWHLQELGDPDLDLGHAKGVPEGGSLIPIVIGLVVLAWMRR